jgi:hypothetical protein
LLRDQARSPKNHQLPRHTGSGSSLLEQCSSKAIFILHLLQLWLKRSVVKTIKRKLEQNRRSRRRHAHRRSRSFRGVSSRFTRYSIFVLPQCMMRNFMYYHSVEFFVASPVVRVMGVG